MKVNKESLKKNKFVQSLKKFANNNIVFKLLVAIVMWVIIPIPAYLYFFVRHLIEPFGFWEEIALLAAFFIGIGWLQGILIFFGIALTLLLIFEDL
jgi:hypothetical protein